MKKISFIIVLIILVGAGIWFSFNSLNKNKKIFGPTSQILSCESETEYASLVGELRDIGGSDALFIDQNSKDWIDLPYEQFKDGPNGILSSKFHGIIPGSSIRINGNKSEVLVKSYTQNVSCVGGTCPPLIIPAYCRKILEVDSFEVLN